MYEQMISNLLLGMKLGGSIMQAQGYREEGRMASEAALFSAAQYRRRAGTWEASAQRAAEDDRRRGALLISRVQAVAAASGGGAADPTVLKIMAGIDTETELAARTRLYEGVERRKMDEMAAGAKEYEAVLARKAGNRKSASSILGGVKTLFDLFGKDDAPASVVAGNDDFDPSVHDYGN